MVVASTPGNVIVLETRSWYRRLKRAFEEGGDDIFYAHDKPIELLLASAVSTFDWMAETPHQKLDKLRITPEARAVITNTVIQFTEHVRREVRLTAEFDWTFTEARIFPDDHVITIHFLLPGGPREQRFEDFLEACREAGEFIPLDFDKKLRDFRSLSRDTDDREPFSSIHSYLRPSRSR
jgi:hypothetical protein